MAIELQRPINPALAQLAESTKAKVKRNNTSSPLMACDPAILGGAKWANLSDFLGGR